MIEVRLSCESEVMTQHLREEEKYLAGSFHSLFGRDKYDRDVLVMD